MSISPGELVKCPAGYPIERLEAITIFPSKGVIEILDVDAHFNFYTCIDPSAEHPAHFYKLVDDILQPATYEDVISTLHEVKKASMELVRPAPKSYEYTYPNLPPLPIRRPTKKYASLFWGLGIWRESWGEAPWRNPPRQRPPPEFESTIEKMGFWLDDWGDPPSKKSGKKK